WLVHAADLDLIERLERGAGWEPRAALLSPFDNLIWDRERARILFGFDFRMEIYVPKAQRRFGYYTMPILSGDRVIGIADPVMDRPARTLRINAVHVLSDAPTGRATKDAIDRAVDELGTFLRARHVERPRA